MLNRFLRGATILGVVLMAAPTLFAAETGTLKVNVADGDGLALPGVTVVVNSPTTLGTRSATSDVEGVAILPQLAPGLYEVDAKLQGFGQAIVQNVRVQLETTSTVSVVLRPAMETEITVSADNPIIDTTSPTVADHVQLETVESLPVSRDYVGYMQLVSGVNVVANGGGVDTPQEPAGKGGLNYSDRGAQTASATKSGSRDNVYYMDGVNVTGMASQTGLIAFNNEVILEQEIISSGVPAEYAGGKGILANIVTKSGGNDFTGSANLYFASKDFVQDYDTSDDRLHAPVDDKFDTAATLGGPFAKDKAWFFASAQRISAKNDIMLADTASATNEVLPYERIRNNGFGKVSLSPSNNDQIVASFFVGDDDIEGSRNITTLPDRRSVDGNTYTRLGASYQRLLTNSMTWNARYGRYTRHRELSPIAPDAGPLNNVLFDPALNTPAYERQFGGAATILDDENTRDSFSTALEWFGGKHVVKFGIDYTNESDSDARSTNGGFTLASISNGLSGSNLRRLTDLGLYDVSEVETRITPALNDVWSSTSAALDTNGNGVVETSEVYAATFGNTGNNLNGVNFTRTFEAASGTNDVNAKRWTAFIQDDFKVHQNLTVNVGVRLAKNKYIDSTGETIVSIDTAFLPRIGAAWDINGDGRRKLSAFYGEYLDDIPMGMVHFAGNRSGSVREEQIFLAGDWYTFRTRGSATTLDSVFAPNVEDPRAKEFNLSFQNDFGNGLVFGAQAYYREDNNLLEDYDFPLYFDVAPNDPNFSQLALTPQDFGYGSRAEVPANVNYYQANLIGAKREYTGIDLDLQKRFDGGSRLAIQYSYKDAKSNSQSDGNADLQGDLYEIDPRNSWMWGDMPGNVANKIKVFGNYKTPFGLDIGGLFYYTDGWAYTESLIFGPGSYDIYINNPTNPEWTNFTTTGTETNPSYYQLDLKFGYKWAFAERASAQFFLDIYNVTNNQDFIEEQAGINDQEFDFQAPTRQLIPRRLFAGARINF